MQDRREGSDRGAVPERFDDVYSGRVGSSPASIVCIAFDRDGDVPQRPYRDKTRL